MSKITTRPLTRRDFLMSNANVLLALGAMPYLSGCANHNDPFAEPLENETPVDTVPPPSNELDDPDKISNPFTGCTLGSIYWQNLDIVSDFQRAFEDEKLAKLCLVISKSQSWEVISTTNRASRKQDDFSKGIAVGIKGKLFGSALSINNIYNRSTSKIEANNSLTWTSHAVCTGSVYSIDWGNHTYKQLYACLSLEAQQQLANILTYYFEVVSLINAGQEESPDIKVKVNQYLNAVHEWYVNFGEGFVSGLWVGMLGKAHLIIKSDISNKVSSWDNQRSFIYQSPMAEATLKSASSGLSSEYRKNAYADIKTFVIPDNNRMNTWAADWKKEFLPHIHSLAELEKVNSTPAPYTGPEVNLPDLGPLTDAEQKLSDENISKNFGINNNKTNNKDDAQESATVIDWVKNRKNQEGRDAYKNRVEENKADIVNQLAEVTKFEDLGKILNNNKNLRLDVPHFLLPTSTGSNEFDSNEFGQWGQFLNQWTTLGVYLTRWEDVIPQLSLANDVLATKAKMTSILVYLWSVWYQAKLIRLADYIDFCYPYAIKFRFIDWLKESDNIINFSGRLRTLAHEFNKILNDSLEYTIEKFYNLLNNKILEQENEIGKHPIYQCWSNNYDFFMQADFGCGLVMMPSGYGSKDTQFIFAGPHNKGGNGYGVYLTNWQRTRFESDRYITDPRYFATLPKLMPLIQLDGKIAFLMIGSNRDDEKDISLNGILCSNLLMYSENIPPNTILDEKFLADSIALVKNQENIFAVQGISKSVYTIFNSYNLSGNTKWYHNRIYKDSTYTGPYYYVGYAGYFNQSISYVCNECPTCGDKTTFYVVPLKGLAERTQVRGVKFSDELPKFVANPSLLYNPHDEDGIDVREILEDTPSKVYETKPGGITLDTIIGKRLDNHRVWKGLLGDPLVKRQ